MSAKKKKANPESSKIRTTVYVSKELLEFAKEKGLNVSKLANNALNRLKMGLGESFKTNSADLVLISQNNQNKREKQWTRGNSNPGSPPCQGDVIAS